MVEALTVAIKPTAFPTTFPAAALATLAASIKDACGKALSAANPSTKAKASADAAGYTLTGIPNLGQAHSVGVELSFSGGGAVELVVKDDGVGFDEGSAHPDAFGLAGMHDRARRAGVCLTFVTEPGAGTQVFARRPV